MERLLSLAGLNSQATIEQLPCHESRADREKPERDPEK
jgi:hypothetical protein